MEDKLKKISWRKIDWETLSPVIYSTSKGFDVVFKQRDIERYPFKYWLSNSAAFLHKTQFAEDFLN